LLLPPTQSRTSPRQLHAIPTRRSSDLTRPPGGSTSDMGLATVEERYRTVHKVYPPDMHERAAREVRSYQELPWATPRLDCYGEGWLEMEKCTPILDLLPEQSVKYREPLRDLLRRVHEAGWWHMDVCLRNVVSPPLRGGLLLDWAGGTPAVPVTSPARCPVRAGWATAAATGGP